MAYADYEFYIDSYYGGVVPELDFPRMASRSSDWIDQLTNDCLTSGLPKKESYQKRIKKAVCAIADAMFQVELAEKNAIRQATEGAQADGNTSQIVSASSGSESVSYATSQQIGASAKEWNNLYSMVGNRQALNDMYLKTALPYLMGVRTDDGIPILYASCF